MLDTDRRTPYCTPCKTKKNRRYQWQPTNCSKCKTLLPQGRRQPYCAVCMSEYNRHTQQKRNERRRRVRAENPEMRAKELADCSAWLKANPLWNRAKSHRRRARMLQAPGSFTGADVARIFASQKHVCNHCGERKTLTVDHVVPISRGGSNYPSNLQGLCRSCNSRKGNRHGQ